MPTGELTAPGTVSRGPSRLTRLWAGWPRWTAWGALLWSAGYATVGGAWWLGVDWYPFASAPLDRTSASLLEGAPAEWVGPTTAVLGLLGIAAASVFLRSSPSRRASRFALGYGVVLAMTATSLVPDYTMLMLLALWPAIVVFAFTGIPGSQGGLGDILYWHRAHLVLVFVGGLLWAGATLAAGRRRRGACLHCGRAPGAPATPTPLRRERLLRRGLGFVWLAVLATLPYDLTRFAWFFGWPLGLSDELYTELQDPPELLVVGLALGVLSTAGAALTHGLVARWGEVLPRWIPGVAGRRVPVMLAVIPASAVTLTLPPAAIMFAGPEINGGFDLGSWGVWLPSMFWLLWAVGLGGATWTYYQRRRTACRHCTTQAASL